MKIVRLAGLALILGACADSSPRTQRSEPQPAREAETSDSQLTVQSRKAIYVELVEFQDSVYCETGRLSDEEAYDSIAARRGITVERSRAISIEGTKKMWDIPPSPCG